MTAHGLMFHHFHDGKTYIQSQGSITAEEFDRMLTLYKKSWNLITAREWFERAASDRLGEKDVCLTFDDALLSQYAIALPVLDKHNLNAFWFVYTAALTGKPEKLELYRYYRYKCFDSVDTFYAAFYGEVGRFAVKEKIASGLRNYDAKAFLNNYPAYSASDKKFRYIRDIILTKAEYEEIMDGMLQKSELPLAKIQETFWMKPEHVTRLRNEGHIVGLHSHTHPTLLEKLSREEQQKEYSENARVLEALLGEKAVSMSHPSNSYNADTLEILRKLGIQVGFRATPDKETYSKLEYPRFDNTFLIKEVRN